MMNEPITLDLHDALYRASALGVKIAEALDMSKKGELKIISLISFGALFIYAIKELTESERKVTILLAKELARWEHTKKPPTEAQWQKLVDACNQTKN